MPGLAPPASSATSHRTGCCLAEGSPFLRIGSMPIEYRDGELNPGLRVEGPASCPLDDRGVAPPTGLAPATSGLTGRRYHWLSYGGMGTD